MTAQRDNTDGYAGYRSMEVYRLAHALSIEVHRFSLSLPKYELYEQGSQLRRAAQSVAANIVEGYGRRRYKAEFIRYLVFAMASCLETIEWLELLHECHPGLRQDIGSYLERFDELGRKMNRFIQAVESRHQTGI
jgi:four helix bundle protein